MKVIAPLAQSIFAYHRTSSVAVLGVILLACLAAGTVAAAERPVSLEEFPRAETHLYMNGRVQTGGLGNLAHGSKMADVDHQRVVRMNRDTLYSSGVFDLEAGNLRLSLPDSGDRYLSAQVISEDHHTVDVFYAPGEHRYSRDDVGSRYAFVIVRTLANPFDEADMKAAHQLQDQVRAEQPAIGEWQHPDWNAKDRNEIRRSLKSLAPHIGSRDFVMFGKKSQVDPLYHLIGVAVGWGGLPKEAAVYRSFFPPENDGETPYELTLKDVPARGFWSVSVYNAEGYFEKNAKGLYSVNNYSATPNEDGSYTIHFGGDPEADNYLPIMPGWNYTLRLYQAEPEVLNGAWEMPRPVAPQKDSR